MSAGRQQAFAAIVGFGWTPAQAAGVVANLEAESGLRPDAVGDGGQAYGIAQWHPPRQADFAAAFGKNIRGSNLAEQLQFVDFELRNKERAAGDALRLCTTPAQAAESFCRRYERPADPDADSRKRAALADVIFAECASTPAPQPQPEPEKKRMPILGLIAAFGPILAQLIPQIASIMQPKGEVPKRNLELAQLAFDTITQAAGAVNVQEAVTKMQADPAVAAAVTQAVVTQPTIMETLTIGADHEKARTANKDFLAAVASDPWYTIIVKSLFNPVMVVTVLTLPLVYIIIVQLVRFMDKVSADVIAQTIGTVIGLVLGGVCGFWMGQTYQQTRQRNNDQQATQPQQG